MTLPMQVGEGAPNAPAEKLVRRSKHEKGCDCPLKCKGKKGCRRGQGAEST